MLRTLVSSVATVFVLALTTTLSGNTTLTSALHDYRVVTVVDGLVQPWSITFLPPLYSADAMRTKIQGSGGNMPIGDLLITERPGRLRIVRQGKLLPQAVEGVPKVFHSSQGGLLEVMPHPNFASNRLLYLTYSKPGATDAQATTALIRGRFENDRLTDVQQLFEAAAQGRNHFSGKIAFDGKGYLFLSAGDRQAPPEGNLEAHPAQNVSNHQGKILRLHDDGRVPADNPLVKQSGARPEIWSYGHRNVQGLAIHPTTGELWANEHGPQGGDELNRIQPGMNYGWPVIGYGVNYNTGAAIHAGTHRDGMQQPVNVWVPSIGISGLMIYTGARFPNWRGNIFVGGMAAQQLSRLTVEGQRVVSQELLAQRMGRIRDVRQGPDGYIYLVTDDRDGKPTPVYRMEPVERAPVK